MPGFNLDNIQCDIWPRFPKEYESFVFFKITDVDKFKDQLKPFADKITTARQAKEFIESVELKKLRNGVEDEIDLKKPKGLLHFPAVNISFSWKGLEKLGITSTKGDLFKKGMYEDLIYEGWDDPDQILPEFKPPANFNDPDSHGWRIHGVFLVAAESEKAVKRKVKETEKAFGFHAGVVKPDRLDPTREDVEIDPKKSQQASIQIVKRIHGNRRRGAVNRGKEHFGFEDHISQPQVKGLDDELKSLTRRDGDPDFVPPGYIFVKHKGDQMRQADWMEDGSFLVFRHLRQMVPEFEQWCEEAAKNTKGFQGPNGAEKLAAHLMGRWKSGAPVQLDPEHDNEENAFRNDFDYSPIEDYKLCPFGAHTRKMRPRKDLELAGEEDDNVIIRRGITYGPEVVPDERMQGLSAGHRGILFACYQSDIRSGYNFMMTRWASNHYFPEHKTATGEVGPGMDAFIGQRRREDHPDKHISLWDGEKAATTDVDLGRKDWVIQQGGEYFFTPPIKAVRDYLTKPLDQLVPGVRVGA